MKEAKEATESYGGQIEITAVNTPLIALDKQGQAVLDLRPDEIQVLEDGQRVKLLDLVPGLGLEERPPVQGVGATSPTGDPVPGPVDDDRGLWRPWRVAVYISTELAGRYVLRSTCEDAAQEAGRLTDLGPVEAVLPDPLPVMVASAGTDDQGLEAILDDVASGATGSTMVERIRSTSPKSSGPASALTHSMTLGSRDRRPPGMDYRRFRPQPGRLPPAVVAADRSSVRPAHVD